jgi:AraC family transcriptional regulator
MPHAIVNVLSRIYQEWFPSTGFEQANAPVLEVYLPGDISAEDYKCEVWIPIVKK